MQTSESQKRRDDAITRLMRDENVSEADAKMLVEVLGVDWPSLKREADVMKVEAAEEKEMRWLTRFRKE